MRRNDSLDFQLDVTVGNVARLVCTRQTALPPFVIHFLEDVNDLIAFEREFFVGSANVIKQCYSFDRLHF